MANIAFLGLGAMGSRMAANLLKAGHSLTVWNRSPEKAKTLVERGAKLAETPRAAVAGVDFAISMVRDDDASRDVWLNPERGALANLPSSATGIESSTVTMVWIEEISNDFKKRRIDFLEAPVSGSRPQAEAGQLIYMVGGETEVLSKAEPILKAMGSTVHHAGPVGSGIKVKLSVNALLGIQVAAMGELIGFLKHSGLDLAKAMEILTSTQVCSPAARAAAANMVAGNFAPLFPVGLMEKDLGYIHDTAQIFNACLPVSDAARAVFRKAIAEGLAEENMTSVVKINW